MIGSVELIFITIQKFGVAKLRESRLPSFWSLQNGPKTSREIEENPDW